MVRRTIGIGLLCAGLLGSPMRVGAASDSGKNAPDHPAPAKEKDAGSKGSSSGSSPATAPVAAPVIPIPEEVVQAEGVRFGGSNGVQLVLPSREALRLPGGFADPTRYLQTLPGVGSDS